MQYSVPTLASLQELEKLDAASRTIVVATTGKYVTDLNSKYWIASPGSGLQLNISATNKTLVSNKAFETNETIFMIVKVSSEVPKQASKSFSRKGA